MSIKYRLEPIHNNISPNGKQGVYPILRKGTTITTREIARQISVQSSFSPGDVCGILETLSDVITLFLSQGNNVYLNGIGTFSLTAGLKDKNIQMGKITGKDLCIRHLNFRMTQELIDKLQGVTFEKE